MLVLALVRVGMVLVRIVPQRPRYALADRGADLVFAFWGAKRQTTIENAAVVLGVSPSAPEARRVARHALRNYARYMADFLSFPSWSHKDISERTEIVGYDQLDEVLARGKGVILVTCHFGNWDIGGATAAARYPFNVVVDRFRPPALDALIQRQRLEKQMMVVPVEQALRKGMAALRANQVLALVVDRPMESGGTLVTFFGRQASVPGGAAAMALKTGAGIVPSYCMRLPDGRFRVRAFPTILAEPTGQRDADIQRVTQQIFSALEGLIRGDPEQWYMFRPFWRAPATAADAARDALTSATGDSVPC